jgi:hypothetical protein
MVTNVSDLAVLGKAFEQSGMFGCAKEGQGMILALTCMTEKISPLKFMQTYHIIEGRPSMRADAMLAKFAERGGKFTVIEKSSTRAAIRLQKDANDLTLEMSIEQAMGEPFPWTHDKGGKRILKKNWSTPWMQKCMLWSRVVSDGVRTVDPGVNMGVYTPEEVQDFSGVEIEVGEHKDKKPKEAPMKTVKGAVVEDDKKPAAAQPPPPENKAPETTKPATVEEVDFCKIPAGEKKGRYWTEFSDKALQGALNRPELEAGYKARIQEILTERANAAMDTTSEQNPFPG